MRKAHGVFVEQLERVRDPVDEPRPRRVEPLRASYGSACAAGYAAFCAAACADDRAPGCANEAGGYARRQLCAVLSLAVKAAEAVGCAADCTSELLQSHV